MQINKYLQQRPLIFDGAMGTYYSEFSNQKCEFGNINDKETILKIHKEYIEAGCKAIRTNTFGANSVSMESSFDTVKDSIINAIEIAKKAVSEDEIFLFADIGPIPSSKNNNTFDEYINIVDIFIEHNIYHFIFETFGDDVYLKDLISYIKSKIENSFIITNFAVAPDGFTRLGVLGSKLYKRSQANLEINAFGFNCISGAYHLNKYIDNFDVSNENVSIMPNAGYPTVINNRTFFENNSDYFASLMHEIVEKGVKIIGGCCGTTPDYIRKTVNLLQDFDYTNLKIKKPSHNISNIKNQKSNVLIEKLNTGEKIIAVELDPPSDTNINFFMEGALKLKQCGVDAITIADCPLARARVDSSLLACKLKRELNINAIPHLTCRDRNINATKALLLGLNIEDINNVLVVTGDPVPTAERDEIKTLFSFNSAILAKYIRTLNETIFAQNPFNVCGALNVNSRNFDIQLKNARKKIDHGMNMFLTQPILTEQAIENLKLAKKELNAKILGGIIPVVSYRNACFMNNEISGISVSDEIIEMYKDVDKEQATELAIKISLEIAHKIHDYVDGYYLITPFKRVDIISEIIKNLN